jgi:DNA-binding GntR family transcriptional regulator
MADMEQDLGTFIREQNPFPEMRLPPDWQTNETIVTFPSVTDFWAKLMQDPHTAVSKVIRITYTAEGQPAQKTYSLYLAYAADEE